MARSTKPRWSLTPEQAAAHARMSVEDLYTLSESAYLMVDHRRTAAAFHRKWEAWRVGRTTMPAIVYVTIERPAQIRATVGEPKAIRVAQAGTS